MKNSPWKISIGTAIFSFVLTIIYDLIISKPILTTIWDILIIVYQAIINFLIFGIRVWWLIIGIILFFIIRKLAQSSKIIENYKPDFYSYTHDKFKFWRWSWEWKWNSYEKAWGIENLQAHCPSCETPMIDHSRSFSLNFTCPRCDFNASDTQCDEKYKIERIIFDNIERKRKQNSA